MRHGNFKGLCLDNFDKNYTSIAEEAIVAYWIRIPQQEVFCEYLRRIMVAEEMVVVQDKYIFLYNNFNFSPKPVDVTVHDKQIVRLLW